MINKQSRLYRASAAALLLSGFLMAEQPTTPTNFDEIVQKYIMDHPEVIMKSLTTYQAKIKQIAADRARQMVLAERDNLWNDPSSPFIGNSKGVTIVEFFDYRCGYCKKVSPTIAKLLETNPEIRVVFKELPILGPESIIAAKASLAANKQGAYMKFHDALLATNDPVTMDWIDRTSASLGLDLAKLKSDMNSPEIDQAILRNSQLAEKLQVKATPTFIIGTETIAGAVDSDGLRSFIEAASGTK